MFEAELLFPKISPMKIRMVKNHLLLFDLESDGLAYTNKIIVGGNSYYRCHDGEGREIEIFLICGYISSYLVS